MFIVQQRNLEHYRKQKKTALTQEERLQQI